METALNSTEPKRKIKTILLCLKTKVVISKFIEALEAQGITDLIEYKIITPEEFDSKPFGDDSEVEILGVNWGMPQLVDKVLSDNPSIKWIHSFSAGVDLLMTPEIRSKSSSVVLTNAKGAFSESLGEFVAFAMLWFCKRGKKWLDDKTSKKWDPGFLSMLSGMTLGIVGYGDIGSECARVAKNGFNMKVLAVKRDPSKCTEKQRSFADEILPSDEIGMQKLLSASDFVVNVMPYTPETHGFFDLQKFSQMKQSAVFMNIGRGKSVVEADLIKALEDKLIGGAYLDVYATEPFPEDSPLWGFENVYMTPHCADWTWNILELSIKVFKQNLEGYIQKGRSVEGLNSKVDFEAGY